jgi:flavodoxin
LSRALVVFESGSDDTKRLALAIAHGLAARLSVDVACARDAPTLVPADVRLLVAGGPAHPSGDAPSRSYRLEQWLAAVAVPRGVQAATFDLRPDEPTRRTADGAMATEMTLVRRLGATPAAPAEHFLLTGAAGRLADGEEDRARRWGQALAEVVAPRSVLTAGRAGAAGAG